MKIKKIKANNYDINYYKTDKYSTIHLSFLFESMCDRKKLFTLKLLIDYILNTNLVYKNKKEMIKVYKDNYSLGISLQTFNVGTKLFTEYQLTFYDPKLIGEDYIDNALEVVYNILFKPKFIDGKLDKEELDLSKKRLLNRYVNDLYEPNYKAQINYKDKVFGKCYLTETLIHNKEEITELLSSINDDDIINLYHEFMDNNLVTAILMGDVEDEFIKKVIKLFKFKNVKELDTDYNKLVEVVTKEPFLKDSDNGINESTCICTYKINNINKDFDRKKAIYSAINMILNGTGLLLHKTMRTELEIVYNASSNTNLRAGLFFITALIDKNNIDKCIKGFDLIIEKLSNRELLEELLVKVKEKVKEIDYIYDENKWNIYDDLLYNTIQTCVPREDYLKQIDSLTVDDIINEVKNLEKKVVYLYEGTKNE